MRNEGEFVADAIRESIQIGEQARLPVEISHFKISSKKMGSEPDDYWSGSGCQGAGPNDHSRSIRLYSKFHFTGFAFAHLGTGWRTRGRKKRLADKATRERVIKEMKESLKRSGFKDYSYTRVANYQTDKSFNGKSITEITKQVAGKSDVVIRSSRFWPCTNLAVRAWFITA